MSTCAHGASVGWLAAAVETELLSSGASLTGCMAPRALGLCVFWASGLGGHALTFACALGLPVPREAPWTAGLSTRVVACLFHHMDGAERRVPSAEGQGRGQPRESLGRAAVAFLGAAPLRLAAVVDGHRGRWTQLSTCPHANGDEDACSQRSQDKARALTCALEGRGAGLMVAPSQQSWEGGREGPPGLRGSEDSREQATLGCDGSWAISLAGHEAGVSRHGDLMTQGRPS